jgi:hypothetical protein
MKDKIKKINKKTKKIEIMRKITNFNTKTNDKTPLNFGR